MTPDHDWFAKNGASLGVQLIHTLSPDRFKPLPHKKAVARVQGLLCEEVDWLTDITPNSGSVIHLSAAVAPRVSEFLGDDQTPLNTMRFFVENGRFAHSARAVPQKVLGMAWPQYRTANFFILSAEWQQQEMIIADFMMQLAAHLGIQHEWWDVEELVRDLMPNNPSRLLQVMQSPVLEQYRWPLYQWLNRTPHREN